MSLFLTVEEVIEINQYSVRLFGGIHGIRDRAALESAVGRFQTGYYVDQIEEAAALWESLSQNHPFLDGNKRTALTAAAVFLKINGYSLQFEDHPTFQWLIGLYEKQAFNKQALVKWLREHAMPYRNR